MKTIHTRITALFTILFLASVSFAQTGSTVAKTDAGKATPVKSVTKRATPASIYDEIKEAIGVIDANYGGAKKIDYNEVFKSSIDSMLHTLDPHSNYFDAKETEQFRTDQSSQYFGIGATIGDLSDPNGKVIGTYIKATFDQAPAHRAGLRYGDKIVSVNGTSTLGKPFNQVRDLLRGPRGTKAKLVVERLGTARRDTVEITRDAVPQPSISEAYMIRPGVGYMAMRGGFNNTTYGEFLTAMDELKMGGMEQLVIDLRDNGGGLVSHAFRVANAFLSADQIIFSQRGRNERRSERYPADNMNPDRSPVVILVNRNTASASEILAGALQDHDRALIVGENTFGKGLVQNPIPLEYGSMLLLTIAKYETPSGRLIQRDYSNGDLYSYYTLGGSLREEMQNAETPRGAESKTDTGRTVYSGGGINPDVAIKPKTIPQERYRMQQKIANPIFAFASELTLGRVKGLESYSINGPITFNHDISVTDFPVDARVFAAFKQFAVSKYKIPAAQIENEREYVERALRSELVTAAYGSQTSFQVFNEYDDQLLRAIELLPQAKQLALQAENARSPSSKQISPTN